MIKTTTLLAVTKYKLKAHFFVDGHKGISEDMSKFTRIIRRKMVLQQFLFHHRYPQGHRTYAQTQILNTCRAQSPSLAAVTSFVSLAITLQAASCWYKACDNSAIQDINYINMKGRIYSSSIGYTYMYTCN